MYLVCDDKMACYVEFIKCLFHVHDKSIFECERRLRFCDIMKSWIKK